MSARLLRWMTMTVAVAVMPVLAACSSSSTSAAATSAAVVTSSAPSSSAVGTSSNADLCQALVAEKAKLKVLGDSFASKVDLSDLAGTKQALSDLLSGANSVVADSASLMSSAPQDVQDALTTIKDTLSSTASGIQSASSFQDLDNLSHAFDSSDMKSAVNTVSDYIGGQCG